MQSSTDSLGGACLLPTAWLANWPTACAGTGWLMLDALGLFFFLIKKVKRTDSMDVR